MIQAVQLMLADSVYAAALRDALARSGPWQVHTVDRLDLELQGVLVVDEDAFHRLPLPIPHPERLVLIARKDSQLLSEIWDAGVVSVVTHDDPLNTVLLAIMAAALRAAKCQPQKHGTSTTGAIPATPSQTAAQIRPEKQDISTKR